LIVEIAEVLKDQFWLVPEINNFDAIPLDKQLSHTHLLTKISRSRRDSRYISGVDANSSGTFSGSLMLML